MNFLSLESIQFSIPIAVGLLVGLIVAGLLHYALLKYIVFQVIQEVHKYGNGWDDILRTILYCLMTNIPFLFIGFLSSVNNPIIGISLCIQSDFTMIFVTVGIIIYLEESRQTKLDPFLFSRDLSFYILCLVCIMIYIIGKDHSAIPIVLLSMGLLFLILQYLNSILQYKFYKDEDFVSQDLLQTQQKSKPSITQLQKIISQQPEKMQNQVSNFFKLINRAVPKQRDRRMYRKFAELVMPIVKAIDIKRERDKAKRSQVYSKHWISRQQSHNLPQAQFLRIDEQSENSKSSFAGTMQRVQTLPPDQNQQHIISKVIRIVFYPLYYISKLRTDMKYALYVLCLGLQLFLLFFIEMSCNYLGRGWANPQLFIFIMSHILTIPNLFYFIKVSESGGHDFYNIFLQSGVWKMSLGVSFMMIINNSVGSNLQHSQNEKIYMIIKVCSIIGLGVYCLIRKLNIKKESIKYPAIIFLAGFLGSIVVICL